MKIEDFWKGVAACFEDGLERQFGSSSHERQLNEMSENGSDLADWWSKETISANKWQYYSHDNLWSTQFSK